MPTEKKVLDQNGLSHFWQGVKPKFVSDVTYDSTTKAIKKQRLSSNEAVTVVTASTLKTDMELNNVGNFKAVSTVANQQLTEQEKANARANIGAGESGFSGSFNDLTDVPTTISGYGITDANIVSDTITLGNATFKGVSVAANQGLSDTEKANARTNLGIPTTAIYTYKGSAATVASLPTHSSTPAPVAGDVWNVTSTGKNYAYVEYNTTSGEDVWDDLGGEFEIESITNSEIDTILAS